MARRGAQPGDRRAATRASPRLRLLLGIALALAALGSGVLARNAFMADKPYAFYPLLVATALLVFALAETVRPHATGVAAVAARAFLLFALALPFVDALYRNSTGLPLVATTAAPTYSYRAAHANPTAFATWWFYYLNEWIREDGIRAAIDAPDPQKKLPFVSVPGSSGRMFDTTIHINNLGFRGPDMARDKGDAFRIVALGESQTFGPTLRDGEKPWPELLQDLFDQHASCGRKIEVINARNRGLYARKQSRAHAPRHPAAQAGSHTQHAWNERLSTRLASGAFRSRTSRASGPAPRRSSAAPC